MYMYTSMFIINEEIMLITVLVSVIGHMAVGGIYNYLLQLILYSLCFHHPYLAG